ncbi:unnamed protein product [Linum tenue]|uniref:RING-type domain-containing protein n=1 Tax=Linum tenue TaxID=586396 RepID=A0AAV0LKH5_9ROSI|nr:unnamed protein product [Linum tenue]
MLLSVFLALFLPCAEKGLSAEELENLPKVAGKELTMGDECAVCLDEIEPEQIARRIPVCNHGFHIDCADKWLSKHPFCPVCRGKIDRQSLIGSAGGGGGGGEVEGDDDSPV